MKHLLLQFSEWPEFLVPHDGKGMSILAISYLGQSFEMESDGAHMYYSPTRWLRWWRLETLVPL